MTQDYERKIKPSSPVTTGFCNGRHLLQPSTCAMAMAALLAGVSSASPLFASRGPRRAPTPPTNTTPWPSLNASKSTYIYAHTSEALGNATDYYFGANLPIYIGHDLLLNSTQQTMMEATVSVLRYPGGSSANKYLWDGDFTTYPYFETWSWICLLYTSPSPRDATLSRMPSSA